MSPASVLDAGCGTGRVAIELARHGIDVAGVDIDVSMIGEARRQGPELERVEADFVTLALRRLFDVVVLAGNVLLYCPVASRSAVIATCAAHVIPGGAMIAGFELYRSYRLDDYDLSCRFAGLKRSQRWSTWDGRPFNEESSDSGARGVDLTPMAG